MTTIKLKNPTTLYGAYKGHGIPQNWLTLPAGDEVEYSRRVSSTDADYLPFVETIHTISVTHEGEVYSTSQTTTALRHPFDGATYYQGAIRRCTDGIWNGCTAGGLWADDGFGNLMEIPWDSAVAQNRCEYSTVQRVPDCVAGDVYLIGDKIVSVRA